MGIHSYATNLNVPSIRFMREKNGQYVSYYPVQVFSRTLLACTQSSPCDPKVNPQSSPPYLKPSILGASPREQPAALGGQARSSSALTGGHNIHYNIHALIFLQ